MISRQAGLTLAGILLAAGCGNTSEIEIEETGSTDQSIDAVAFVPTGSDIVMIMTIDGTDIEPRNALADPRPVWPDQTRIIASVCGMDPEVTIEVISPGGASLGPLDESNWIPEISPVEPAVLVACGRNDNGDVLLVADSEVSGSRNGWSREGRGGLSDRIEILAIAMDGSVAQEVTSNLAGDWLPKWSPDGTKVTFESNVDGNTEIYVVESNPRAVLRLTENDGMDHAPVWSRDGNHVAFSAGGEGAEEVWLVGLDGIVARPSGQPGSPVAWVE